MQSERPPTVHRMSVHLALDPGKVRVGVSVSDPTGTLARPLLTIPRKPHKAFLDAVRNLVLEHGAAVLVVGMPLDAGGKVGKDAQRSLALAHELRVLLNIPVETQDETMTTAEALEILRENGASPVEMEKRVDAASAALILSRY